MPPANPTAARARNRGRDSHRAQVATVIANIDAILTRMAADKAEPRVAAWARKMIADEGDVKAET